jgi:hypothetical protein
MPTGRQVQGRVDAQLKQPSLRCLRAPQFQCGTEGVGEDKHGGVFGSVGTDPKGIARGGDGGCRHSFLSWVGDLAP